MKSRRADKSLSRRQEKKLLKAAGEYIRTHYPKSDRTDCPTPETLDRLARRRIRLADIPPLADHIGMCSPCFIQFCQYQSALRRRTWIGYGFASAAAIALIFLGVALFREAPAPLRPEPEEEVARGPEPVAPPVIPALLDLRNMGVTRGGGNQTGAESAPRLPRANLALSIVLPIGSEEGAYEVAFADSSGEQVARASGEARFADFKETLEINVDLSELPAGQYRLGLRRPGFQWASYDIRLE